MFNFKISALQQAGVTLTLSAAVSTILNLRNVFCNVLLIFSLCCSIIVSAPQAVAFAIPPTATLMMSQPLVNTSRKVEVFPKAPQKLDVVLTPGQQVINAVPDNERGDFIMYELAIALQALEEAGALQRKLFKNLHEVAEHYGNKLTNLQNVPIYGKFPAELLQWIEAEFNLTHRSVYNQMRSRSDLLCNSEGVCYGSQDIGCFCCPF